MRVLIDGVPIDVGVVVSRMQKFRSERDFIRQRLRLARIEITKLKSEVAELKVECERLNGKTCSQCQCTILRSTIEEMGNDD